MVGGWTPCGRSLETITAENEGLTAQVEALRTETAEQKALPEAIQKQKDEGFRLLGEPGAADKGWGER